ncbi:MAG: hypothetical protein AVDCRST_MAG89-2673, partial [uncultured Gemmatimonadetes bacterium]
EAPYGVPDSGSIRGAGGGGAELRRGPGHGEQRGGGEHLPRAGSRLSVFPLRLRVPGRPRLLRRRRDLPVRIHSL